MTRIAVIQPTRGLIFSQAQSALEQELRSLKEYRCTYEIYRSWDLKIPDCVNEKVDEALEDGFDYALFSEEDTVIPKRGLHKMLLADGDITAIDYGVQGWGCITRNKENPKEILWCGLGCTLVKRKVFDSLEKPYFRSDKQLLLNFYPEEIRWVDAPKDAYGGQDIWFCMHAREKGFTIKQVEGECMHLKLDELGRPEVNHGLHKISQKPIITKRQEV